jgi:CheY-like chemotaxis protein
MLGIVRPGAVPSPAAERREQKQEKGPGKEEGPEAKGDREKARPAKGKEPKEQKAGAGEARPEPGAREARLTSAVLDTLDLLLKEIRVVRAVQEDILAALRGTPAPPPGPAGEETPSLTPIRARRRKTVVLVDDDPQTREAALAEFHQADVPVRACGDGNAALAAIAEDKPDVIILEIAITGDMEGRDVINMVKATMEWVDIPIILWTRGAVSSQKEARQLHGADEVVLKSSGPQALLARVITVFRRG